MEDKILKAFRFCMKWEGGSKYTNDPNDSGGPTKYGVALNYDKGYIPDKNKDGKVDATDVKLLEEKDALKIYTEQYWNKCKCKELPYPIAFMYVDMCYNIGPSSSPKILQQTLRSLGNNIVVDGILGKLSIELCNKVKDMKSFLRKLNDNRLNYYMSRKKWNIYGKGWTNRSNDCLTEALKLC